MKSVYLILGLFAVLLIAGCSSGQDSMVEEGDLNNEDDHEHGVDDVHDEETTANNADTTEAVPVDADSNVEDVVVVEEAVVQPDAAVNNGDELETTEVAPTENVQVAVDTTESTVKEFDMIAKKWDFDPATITVEEGDTVKLNVESIDVSHGIAIPDFGLNEFLRPGEVVNMEFVADKKGTFSFFCSVSCGSGHSGMRGTLIVE